MTREPGPTATLLLTAIITIVAGNGVAALAIRSATPLVDTVTQQTQPAVGIDRLDAGDLRPEASAAPAPQTPAPASSGPPSPSGPPPPPTRQPKTSGPINIEIPTIGVDAYVVDLGLDDSRRMEVPTHFPDAGWWTGSAEPGEVGPSVIVGHVASRRGKGVFYRLSELAEGDQVLIERVDGPTARYVVQWSATYAKDRFPTNLVYGPTDEPTLRLVTCAGTFDRRTGHYVDNHVVYLRYAGQVDL